MLRKGQTNSGSFTSGWNGKKECLDCGNLFYATSGRREFCDVCIGRKLICPVCNKKKRDIYHRFCSNSCAGRWKYKNCKKVREAIAQGLVKAQKTASARAKLQKGKPKFGQRGPKNWNWKGGIYRNERHTLMGRIEYKNWRKAVFERDNYTCQKCGRRGGNLNADHVIPYYIDKTKTFDVNNGQTLCVLCHKSLDTWGHKVKTRYKYEAAFL